MRQSLVVILLALGPALAPAQEAAPDVTDAVGIERAKVDTTGVAATVSFRVGSAALGPQARGILDAAARDLAAQPGRIELGGHTDSSGAERLNQALSMQRAQAVRDYLAAHGVAPERLTAVGYGPYQPVDTNDSDAGRARNRRVDLRVGD